MISRQEHDELWRQDGKDFGWTLPEPKAAWKRLPIIRWFRFIWARIMVEVHYLMIPFGIRTGYDDWVIYAIYRGWY